MRRGPVRTAFALITALVMVCVASASAVESLSWKTVLRVKAGDVRFYAFAAASSRAAWVLGERIGRRGYARPVSFHWDGERWRSSALPSEPTYARGEYVLGTRLSASNARNAWLLLPGEFGYADGEPEECGLTPVPPEKRRADRPSRLLRWTGSGWQDSLTVEDAVLTSVVAVGSGEAWAFGEDLRGPVVFQYDGTKWTRKSSPVRVDDAKAHGSEAWVVGESAEARRAGVWRFDGALWRSVPFDGVHPENKTVTKKKDGRWTGYSSLAVLDGGEIAVSGLVLTGPWCVHPNFWSWKERPYQLLWSGGSWKREQGVEGRQLTSQAADGRGGRYAVGMKMSSLMDAADELKVFHRTASGRWSDQGFPGSGPIAVFSLSGAASLWVVGEDRGGRNQDGVIMRYVR